MDLTVDSSTDSNDVEYIIESFTDFKVSVDEDCTSGDNSSWLNSESDDKSGAKCAR